MNHTDWQCPKCENSRFETDELRATGGGFTRFFNVQSKKFITVTCTQCQYTEIYKQESSTLGNVLDFFGN
jgi:predicted nucleic-acid-binding Zn-ribbon protein